MRIPLHSIEAEMSLLGSLFLAGKSLPEVEAIIDAEDFFRPAHQLIFKALIELGKFGIDIVTLRNKLKEKGQLDDCGGVDYLLQMSEYVPSPANAMYYAQIVSDKAVLRRLSKASEDIQSIIHAPEFEGADDRVSKAIQVIEAATERKKLGSFSTLSSYVRATSDQMDRMQETGECLTGVTTGFSAIDELITGWIPGEFVVIGARPSMGKTAIAVQFAISAAKAGIPSAIFSAEMSGKSLTNRLIAQMAGYSSKVFRSPIGSEKVYQDIANAMEELDSLPVGIDETSDLNPDNMLAQCKAFQKSHGGGHCVFILDYLQYVTQTRKGETQNDATTRVSRICKNIAKSLDCTFIALAQLSRDVEKRDDKRPKKSDLRDSGSLEQDADIVAMLYRDEYYKAERENRREEYQSEAEFIIRKNRNDQLGVALLAFRPSQTKFLSVKA